MSDYAAFLETKRPIVHAVGPTDVAAVHEMLFPFQADLVRWAVRKGRAALFADCVAAETIIEGPEGRAAIGDLAERGEALPVWSLGPDGTTHPALASVPFRKGRARFYRFELSSGESITVTEGHRFLTDRGWQYAGDLGVGARLAISDASRLPSSAARDLSTLPPDGRGSMRTTADWSDRYLPGPRRCDPRPQSATGSDLALVPSRVGARALGDPSLPADGQAPTSAHSRPSLGSDRPSTPGSSRPDWSEPEVVEYQPRAFGPEPSAVSTRTVLLERGGSTLAQPGRVTPPLAGSQSEAVPSLVTFATVVSVQYIRTDWYYDLHVPGFENYLANGIWSHNTGLGKTFMQLEWARLLGQRTLILAPLAVSRQTINEAAKLGIEVVYAKHQGEAGPGITITNYERLDRFDAAEFGAVILDESSILKSFSGTTKRELIAKFADTPYRLCCTATPAPNDIEELCNHAHFLGLMTPALMRSTFFIADNRGQFMKYRLKKHARTAFYRWLASWAMAVKRPSDLGYEDGDFLLPPLVIEAKFIATDWRPEGQLFFTELHGVTERAQVRKATIADRVDALVALVESDPEESWLIWCGLNDEGRQAARRLPGAVIVEGSDSAESKTQALLDFAEGRTRILITKVTIAGFGLNFQRCARMAFLGLGDSFEQYYQALRRCWRFGQTREVRAYIVLTEIEEAIYANVIRKEAQAAELSEGLISNVIEYERGELFAGTSAGDDYEPRAQVEVPSWLTA